MDWFKDHEDIYLQNVAFLIAHTGDHEMFLFRGNEHKKLVHMLLEPFINEKNSKTPEVSRLMALKAISNLPHGNSEELLNNCFIICQKGSQLFKNYCKTFPHELKEISALISAISGELSASRNVVEFM